MRPFIWFLVLFSSGSGAAFADIVGGLEVGPRDAAARSTVALYSPAPGGRGGSLCTASLIGKATALTAAHCLTPGARPAVVFGRDLGQARVRARPVSGARVHPDWQRKGGRGMDQGDLAVVSFPGGLPSGYAPVKLASQETRDGSSVSLAGFGISDARARSGSGRLRKTRVRVADSRPGKGEMIVDQSRGRGACHGDSGGPAFGREGSKRVLTGVTNRSHPAGAPDDCGHQAIFTKVSAYRPWIRGAQADLGDPGRFSGRVRRLRAR